MRNGIEGEALAATRCKAPGDRPIQGGRGTRSGERK
ncbi:hypothetical protein Esi_0030_0034 [Ectocarpus siliculosus]|uniref:Uncharacterized protein n=1 Tax=Ectocarpus siliculosus TaxID=2880 RepID=D8LKF6_ECTSI|nr:hypothetical protein Esi_0030_0034 [Ectocarpus siliculosus]|eukprot:CBN74546.1 hypothetical protein Esi_0030_0034 [Ectocarpus siliculosus]